MPENPPKVEDIKNSANIQQIDKTLIDKIQQKTSQAINRASETRKGIDDEGRRDFYVLRKRWSQTVAKMIWALIIFQIVVTVGIGLNWLNFEGNAVVLRIVLAENPFNIVGLAYIIVRYLFNDPQG